MRRVSDDGPFSSSSCVSHSRLRLKRSVLLPNCSQMELTWREASFSFSRERSISISWWFSKYGLNATPICEQKDRLSPLSPSRWLASLSRHATASSGVFGPDPEMRSTSARCPTPRWRRAFKCAANFRNVASAPALSLLYRRL